jgi:hypothetical protein
VQWPRIEIPDVMCLGICVVRLRETTLVECLVFKWLSSRQFGLDVKLSHDIIARMKFHHPIHLFFSQTTIIRIVLGPQAWLIISDMLGDRVHNSFLMLIHDILFVSSILYGVLFLAGRHKYPSIIRSQPRT